MASSSIDAPILTLADFTAHLSASQTESRENKVKLQFIPHGLDEKVTIYLLAMKGNAPKDHLLNLFSFQEEIERTPANGRDWFAQYEKLLPITRRPALRQAYDAIPANTDLNDIQTFIGYVRVGLTTNLISELQISNFRNYLLNGPKKAPKEAVEEVNTFLDAGNLLLPYLGAAALTDNEKAVAFYNSMPAAWRTAFEEPGNRTVANTPFVDLLAFMTTRETRARAAMAAQQNVAKKPAARRSAPAHHDPSHGNPDANNNHSCKRSRRGGLRGGSRGQGNNRNGHANGVDNDRPVSSRIPDDTPCPIHPGKDHTWGECNQNAKNAAAKASGNAVNSNNGNNKYKNNNSNKSRSPGYKPGSKKPAEQHMNEAPMPKDAEAVTPMTLEQAKDIVAMHRAARAAGEKGTPESFEQVGAALHYLQIQMSQLKKKGHASLEDAKSSLKTLQQLHADCEELHMVEEVDQMDIDLDEFDVEALDNERVAKAPKTETLTDSKSLANNGLPIAQKSTVLETHTFSSSSSELHHLDVLFQSTSSLSGPSVAGERSARRSMTRNCLNEPLQPGAAKRAKTTIPESSSTSRLTPEWQRTINASKMAVVKATTEIHHAIMADEKFPVNEMEDNEQYYISRNRKSSGLTIVLENETLPDEKTVDLSALVPVTILLTKSIGGIESDLPLRVLLDSGADRSQLHARVLKAGMHPHMLREGVLTTMGVREGVPAITLEEIILPEFSRTRRITKPIEVGIFDAPSRYDMIVGRDLLSLLGIVIDFKKGNSRWGDLTVAMRDRDTFLTPESAMVYFIDLYTDDENLGDGYLLEAKYDKVDTDELSSKQEHLTPEQRKDLAFLLSERSKLFSGELGLYPDKKVHLNLDPNAQPVHHRPYAVPRNIHTVFKGEIDHLVKKGRARKMRSD